MREAFLRHHDQMCISTVTLMELIYGAEKSSNPSRNLADVEGFAARLEVLKYDQEAAAHPASSALNWPASASKSAPMTR